MAALSRKWRLWQCESEGMVTERMDVRTTTWFKTQWRWIMHLGGQWKAKIDDGKRLCYLSRLIQGENWGLYQKNECKISSGLAGMARQLLPEASWRKTQFLTCRENFVGKNWSKSLEIDNSHWWKLKILIGGHLATLKWLVNCIPEGPWRDSRYPLHLRAQIDTLRSK